MFTSSTSLPANMKSLGLFLLLVAFSVNVSPLSINPASAHIVDGSKQLSNPYKTIIEVHRKGVFIRHCGAAQLNQEWYLTTAECVEQSKTESMRLIAFDEDHRVKGEEKIWLDKKIHPDYDKETKENNIALLRGYPYEIPNNLPHLPRNNKNETYSTASGMIFGWRNWPQAKSLTMAPLKASVINPYWCKLAYPLQFTEGEYLCVFSFKGNTLSQDIVGVPLVLSQSDSVNELIGIATDMRPFTDSLPMPRVFTSVAPYVEWIQKETNINTK